MYKCRMLSGQRKQPPHADEKTYYHKKANSGIGYRLWQKDPRVQEIHDRAAGKRRAS